MKTRRSSPTPEPGASAQPATRRKHPAGQPSAQGRPDHDGEPQALTTTFWFDSGTGEQPYSATVRFSGRRVGVTGLRGPADTFVKDETIDRVIPNSGPVSVTTRVHGINRGEWVITADVLRERRTATGERTSPRRAGRAAPAVWSWRRWTLSAGAATPVKTRWAPLTAFDRMPAVIPGSFTVLVLLGVLAALFLQSRLVAAQDVDPGRVLTVSLVALLAGLVGAKLWYLALHPRAWRTAPGAGWCIQGFLVGAAVAVVAGLAVAGLPIGVVLDGTAPALFAGLAIGRVGCFFTGCCCGRPSRSRWAVWSSDRRVGARRIPTQLLESAAAGVIALTAWVALTQIRPAVSGALFVASLAAYTLGRQFLLRLRVEPRRSALGGPVSAGAAAVVLIAAAVLLFVPAN